MRILSKLGLAVLAAINAVLRLIIDGWLGKAVRWLFDLFKPVVQPTRGVLIPILLCGLALGFTDQGRELARSLALNPFQGGASVVAWVSAFIISIGAMTWWAVQSWWWARILLDRRVTGLREGEKAPRKWLEDWTPRIYAMSIYGIATIPLLADGRWPDAIILLIVALILLWILVQRRRRYARYLTSTTAQQVQGIAAFEQFTKGGFVMLALSVLLPFLMFALFACWRTELTFFLGTLAVAFIAMSCILPVLALLTISEGTSRAPVFVILFVYVIAVGVLTSYLHWDNHTVRAVREAGLPPTAPIQTNPVADAYATWARRYPDSAEPLILVYSAGGGLRAAYWTSALLSELENKAPGFHCRVFAISGVSGGSVGAVFWAGALHATGGTANDRCKLSAPLDGRVNDSLNKDYLAAGLSGLLFNDLLSAFIPAAAPWSDRAVAMEQAWEAGFEKVFDADLLAEGFHALWPAEDKAGWMPILLLNGTHQETGQRIITSNIRIRDEEFPKAIDFFEKFGREIASSTAALNSARFTYVSPAGRITDPEGKVEYGHVIDGGYFENYGARTIVDLHAALKAAPDIDKRRILLVEMVNDTDLADEDAARCAAPTRPEDGTIWAGALNEVVAPIKGMLMARQARGMVDARMAAQAISPEFCVTQKDAQQAADFFQLRLCPGMEPSPPLGWVMGEASVANIDKLVAGQMPARADGDEGAKLEACAADLRKQLDDLIRAVSG